MNNDISLFFRKLIREFHNIKYMNREMHKFVNKITKGDKEVQELLKHMLLEMPDEDVKIILTKLIEVKFAENVPVELGGCAVWVKKHKRFNGKWIMEINPEWWLYFDEEFRREVILHELYEIIQHTKRGESIHMLVFYFNEYDEEPLECSICHNLTKEYYILDFEVEEVRINPYLIEFESICEDAGIDSDNFIICWKCLQRCCAECPYFDLCDKHCRFPEKWLNSFRRTLKSPNPLLSSNDQHYQSI